MDACPIDPEKLEATVQQVFGYLGGAGVENVAFHDASHDTLPQDGRFHLITTFDCLHDMAHPAPVIAAIRRARAMTRAAGFTHFRTHDFDHPMKAYYEVRP